MNKEHIYKTSIVWTGVAKESASSRISYSNNHEISFDGKPIIPGSVGSAFGGDDLRYNPEDLLASSLAACHMLFYLSFCGGAKVIIKDYQDEATITLNITDEGKGRITEVILNPRVTIGKQSNSNLANELHHKAHERCFLANSMSFPIYVKPTIIVSD